MKIKGGFQKLIVDLCSLKKDDILVCVENINDVDLDKSRKGIVNVSVKAGEILDKYQKEADVMPKGEYYYADFFGSWQEYYLFTFSFFIAAVANKNIHQKIMCIIFVFILFRRILVVLLIARCISHWE
ncbi:hypothetical protein AYR06_01405 [Escherichia albertii]|uniref:hypothetical protein n=1 Tax=Escherichia albertii TaxID=208962 RepID=UPI0013DDF45B|nr:hypothetical protein [Escherichia albertii]WKU76337.1 hypothetical protein AYR06_01405 [Escherichia albertii]